MENNLSYGADTGAIWNDKLELVAMAPPGLSEDELVSFINEFPEMLDGIEECEL
jgi:hypothetical protein